MLPIFVILIFACLLVAYFFLSFESLVTTNIILTVSTFLFAIFAGFFIARQGSRYTQIRQEIANFDGEMSALYRAFRHLNPEIHKKLASIIEKHYKTLLKKKSWDHYFTHKSTTLSEIHELLFKDPCKKSCDIVQNWALRSIFNSLEQIQISRKQMINLHLERIPKFEWILIIVLGMILLITISFVPATHGFLTVLLKAAFGTSVIVVLILLYQFDKLRFFEGQIGEKSARDVLDIIKGKK